MPVKSKVNLKYHFFNLCALSYLILSFKFIPWFKDAYSLLNYQIIALYVVPLVLFAILQSRSQKRYRQRARQLCEQKRLSMQQLSKLQDALNPMQWDAFDAVILPLLEQSKIFLATYENQDNNPGNQQAQTFDVLICKVAKVLKQLKNKLSWRQATLNSDIAITLFATFRIIYNYWQQGIANTGNNEAKNITTEDDFIFFKRLPSQLSLYLGTEYWRAFELLTVIKGDISTLSLNKDIANLLMEIIDGPSGDKLPKPETGTDANTQFNSENNNKITVPAASNLNTNDNLSAPIQKDTDAQPTKAAQKTKSAIPAFLRWLNKRVASTDARYHPNRGEYVFSESLSFGDNVVFVTDALLDKYFSISGVAPKTIMSELETSNTTTTTHYTLKKPDKPLKLVRVDGVTVSNAVGQKHAIQELATQEPATPKHVTQDFQEMVPSVKELFNVYD